MQHAALKLIPLALLIACLATNAPAEEPATIVEVVVNGAGLTKKTALEDAYRNAVQQVVGLYVDADTMVENDELVRDKILATSNGFIVDSKELSSRASNGLVRVNIRAKVESRKLLAGLNAARIITRKFDGESLFAKALTNMERKENLQETLLKILADLGPMLQAEMIGEPDFDETTSELVFQLRVQPDYEQFVLFRQRLGTFLDTVCIRKTEVGVQATKGSVKGWSLPPEKMREKYFSSISPDLLWGPVLKTNKQWVLWLQTFENKSFTSLRWTGYVLDTDWRPVAISVLRRIAIHSGFYSRKKDSFYRFNFEFGSYMPVYREYGRTFVSTNFRDANGELILFDKFELLSDSYGYGISFHDYSLLPPALVNYCPRKIGVELARGDGRYFGFPNGISRFKAGAGGWSYVESSTLNLYVAPVLLALAWDESDPRLVFRRFIRVERRLKVQPDELRAIRKIEQKIDYTKAVVDPNRILE